MEERRNGPRDAMADMARPPFFSDNGEWRNCVPQSSFKNIPRQRLASSGWTSDDDCMRLIQFFQYVIE